MTKTAIIQYNEADETLLQLFFQKLKIHFTQSTETVDKMPYINPKLSKKSQKLLRDMHHSILEAQAMARGEIQAEQTYEEYLIELKQIADANRTYETV